MTDVCISHSEEITRWQVDVGMLCQIRLKDTAGAANLFLVCRT